MNKYENYKSSGVDWLGEIPSHWEVEHSKWLFAYRKEKARKGNTQLTASQKYGVIPQSLFMELEDRKVTQVEFNYEILKHVEKGDFVISMRSFQGGIEYCDYTGSVSSAYVVLIPQKQIYSPYFKYLLKSSRYIEALQSTSNLVRDGQALRYENFCMIPLVIPPKSEQCSIAHYLDQKTAEIEQAMDIKIRQIDRLKEYKQILIQQTVTQGLNPTAPTKASGVEWIGDVPEHWKVTRLKFITKEHSGNGFPIELQGDNGNIPFLKVSDFSENKDVFIDHWNNSVSSNMTKKNKWNIVPKNTLVTAKIGEALRKNHRKLLLVDSIIDNNCIGLESVNVDMKFNFYLHCILDFDWFVNPGAVPSLAMQQYRNWKVAIPPLSEQHQIADYLDRQTAKIDDAINLYTAQIDKLKEYKTILINDVVMGKVRV